LKVLKENQFKHLWKGLLILARYVAGIQLIVEFVDVLNHKPQANGGDRRKNGSTKKSPGGKKKG